MHNEATAAKFTGGLNEQIDAVYDEVELRNDALSGVVVGQVFDVVIG